MDLFHQAILKTKSATICFFFSLLLLSFSSSLSLSFFLSPRKDDFRAYWAQKTFLLTLFSLKWLQHS